MVSLPVCLAHADRPDIRNGLISCQPASLNLDFNLAQSRVQTSTWPNPDLNMIQSNSGMANPFRRSNYQMKRAKRFWIGCQLWQSKVQLNVIIWSQSLLLQQQRSSIIGQCFQLPRLKMFPAAKVETSEKKPLLIRSSTGDFGGASHQRSRVLSLQKSEALYFPEKDNHR